MGMMLRRNNRKADYLPEVNGKPVKKEPKSRTLTPTTSVNDTNATPSYANYTAKKQ